MSADPNALEPCPFCGGDVTLVEKDSGLLVFLCPEGSPCVGSGMGNFGRVEQRETAIAAWNRRTTDATIRAQAEQIARLREALESYAHDYCEMGKHHECCGKLSSVECGGCAARQALEADRG